MPKTGMPQSTVDELRVSDSPGASSATVNCVASIAESRHLHVVGGGPPTLVAVTGHRESLNPKSLPPDSTVTFTSAGVAAVAVAGNASASPAAAGQRCEADPGSCHGDDLIGESDMVPVVGPACEHMFVSRIEQREQASILHADLDSFYASVEQRDHPELRGRPVIVGGGVVLAASYEAKAFGIRTPMNGREALAMCPRAVVMPARFEAYSEASNAVFEIFRDTTPIVEGISIDEAFLDVGGLRRISGSPMEIGARLRARVATEVGLPITVGIASTKFLAKVASAVAKPDGLARGRGRDRTRFPASATRRTALGCGCGDRGKTPQRGIAHRRATWRRSANRCWVRWSVVRSRPPSVCAVDGPRSAAGGGRASSPVDRITARDGPSRESRPVNSRRRWSRSSIGSANGSAKPTA